MTFPLVRVAYWRSLTISVWDSICDLNYSIIYFTNLRAFVIGACMLRIPMLSLWIFSLLNIQCQYLSLLISFSLKPILLDNKTTVSACFSGPFTQNIFFSILSHDCWSWDAFLECSKKMIIFLYNSVSLYLFIVEMRSLILRDISDWRLLIPDTLLLVMLCMLLFFLFCWSEIIFPVFSWLFFSSLSLCFPISTFCRVAFVANV